MGIKEFPCREKLITGRGIADGLVQTGHANYFKGWFQQAKNELTDAVSIYNALNDKNGLSNACMVTGQMSAG